MIRRCFHFIIDQPCTGGPLQLEIHVTPFDYVNGKLMPTEENPSMWLTPLTQPKLPSAYAKERKQLHTGENSYRYDSVQNPPHVKPNQFVSFIQSSAHSDAGQSTMPFIDSRPVIPTNPLALDGLGIMYRGHEKYGGFVAIKTITIDLTNYMNSAMTDKQKNFYRRNFRQPVPKSPPILPRGRITRIFPKDRSDGRDGFFWNRHNDY